MGQTPLFLRLCYVYAGGQGGKMPWDAKTAGRMPCRDVADLRLFVIGQLAAVQVAAALMPAGEPLGQQERTANTAASRAMRQMIFHRVFIMASFLAFLSLYHGESAFVNGGSLRGV